MKNKGLALVLILALLFGMIGCEKPNKNGAEELSGPTTSTRIEKEGKYSAPEDVAEYIHIYKQLPQNYLTKKEASELGWQSQKGNLRDVTDKMSIGGDIFGNREGKLPKATKRQWYECDVNYNGGFRGAERLVYSNDGLIFYTQDHYQTFTEITFEE